MQPSSSSTSTSQDNPRVFPWFYILLWMFFAYLYFQIVQFSHTGNNNPLIGGLYFIEFGVHEISHIVTMFLPPTLTALAGSVGEIGFTLLIAYAGFKARSYFAGIFGLLWTTLAMNSVGRYMADARAQQIPLAGPGDAVQHDWHFIFSQLGWLEADATLGSLVQWTGNVIGTCALLFGLYVIVRLVIQRNNT